MIGKTLQNVLNEKNVTVNELARKISVSPQTLYSIIKRDNMKVDIGVLLKICTELDVSIEKFYGDYFNSYQKKQKAYDSITQEAIDLYVQLDTGDQGEIRGEMRQMLKSEKYKTDKKKND